LTITAIDINTYQLAHPSKEAIKVASTYIELPRFQGECLLKSYAHVASATPELTADSLKIADSDIQVIRKATPVLAGWNERGGYDCLQPERDAEGHNV